MSLTKRCRIDASLIAAVFSTMAIMYASRNSVGRAGGDDDMNTLFTTSIECSNAFLPRASIRSIALKPPLAGLTSPDDSRLWYTMSTAVAIVELCSTSSGKDEASTSGLRIYVCRRRWWCPSRDEMMKREKHCMHGVSWTRIHGASIIYISSAIFEQ